MVPKLLNHCDMLVLLDPFALRRAASRNMHTQLLTLGTFDYYGPFTLRTAHLSKSCSSANGRWDALHADDIWTSCTLVQ